MSEPFLKRRSELHRLDRLTRLRETAQPGEVSDSLFKLCRNCHKLSPQLSWERALSSCPNCGYYERMSALQRLQNVMDEAFVRIDSPAVFSDPLCFPGYQSKWEQAALKSGVDEAIIFSRGFIMGQECIVGAMEANFLMASMGRIVGDRIVSAFELAGCEGLPLVIFCASGGARMQEGIVSLMQMRRTAEAVARHRARGLAFISVLTDPTTGGVTASFASLGDLILAEPEALVAFAGPRVIRETIRCELPSGFQKAEFLADHGFVDLICPRNEMRATLGRVLSLLSGGQRENSDFEEEPKERQGKDDFKDSYAVPLAGISRKNASAGEIPLAAERVLTARQVSRKSPVELAREMTSEWTELRGDRCFADDAAVRGALARLEDQPVLILCTEKGRGAEAQMRSNFGMPHPEGYRKAHRLMTLAERLGLPILTFIDTPGAFPGIGAEERGQGQAIAENLLLMSELKVPLISVITGEAGSGGALALAVSDRLYMLENSVYTLLSPEGFASILWKDQSRFGDAAALMQPTAEEMLKRGICHRIFGDDASGLKEQLLEDIRNLKAGGRRTNP